MSIDVKSGPGEIGGPRAKVLAAAMQILSAQGAEKLSLRAIAESAGIGIASIYHYFENKEELLLNLAIMGFGELSRHIISFQEKGEYPSAMQASARAYFDFAEKNSALFSLMFGEQLMARHEALRDAAYKTFQVYETAVKADDRVPAEHQENVALALWALGRGIAAITSSYPNGELPSEMSEKLYAGISYLIVRPR